MPIADFPDGCDVLGETHAMVDVECLVVLQVLYDLGGVKIYEDCVLFNFKAVDLDEGTAVLL
jgi:hypothetical protein